MNIECLMRKDERHLLKLVWYWLFAFHSTLDVGRSMFDVHLLKHLSMESDNEEFISYADLFLSGYGSKRSFRKG